VLGGVGGAISKSREQEKRILVYSFSSEEYENQPKVDGEAETGKKRRQGERTLKRKPLVYGTGQLAGHVCQRKTSEGKMGGEEVKNRLPPKNNSLPSTGNKRRRRKGGWEEV